MVELVSDAEAFNRLDGEQITALTQTATSSTFYIDGLTAVQRAAIDHVVAVSEKQSRDAAEAEHRTFIAAFVDGQFAGFIIAAVNAPGDRELDWMMVDPDFHGGGVAAALMESGISWLGEGQSQWLNVIQHNHRAIHFYRKFGFEIDPVATTDHAIPHHIMRRPAKTS